MNTSLMSSTTNHGTRIAVWTAYIMGLHFLIEMGIPQSTTSSYGYVHAIILQRLTGTCLTTLHLQGELLLLQCHT